MRFKRYELPFAYSMMTAARRIRPRRDGGYLFEQYFLYWTAFNNIYTTISNIKGCQTQVKKNTDGSVVTIPNGNVNIPDVALVSEGDQMYLALDEFKDDLKHALIIHDSTKYFLNRVPFWQGAKIEYDHIGQRVNGVINVNYTSDRKYPVWSPIDIQYYQEYLENPENHEIKDFLARQIIDLLYTIRMNLMQGSKKLDDANDIKVVENALPLLELIVNSFIR